jgi:hypothetical protein
LTRWILPLIALTAAIAQAPKYSGPIPPSPDLPFLKHASNLVPAEAVEVKEEKRKDDTVYVIAGEGSPSKTPLELPVFLLKTEKLDPLKLQMYRLQAVDGHREISAMGMKNAEPIHVIVTRVANGVFKLEVGDSLDNGEYMLSLERTTKAFCFVID